MNKRIKALSLIIALLMCFAVFSMTAYAVADPGVSSAPAVSPENPGGSDTPGSDSGSGTDSGSDTTPDPNAPGGDTSGDTGSDTSSGDTSGGYDNSTGTDGEYVDPGYVDTDQSTGGYVDSYTNEDGYYYYDENQMANSLDNTAGNVSDYTNLYNTSNINENELKSNKWSNIELNISDENVDGAIDFSAIKTNKDDADDGHIYLYVGIVLIGLSIIGILYFIIATTTYKKKLKKLKAREERQRQNAMHRAQFREQLRDEYPTGDDYFRQTHRKRYASSSELGYAERKRLKADTAEIPKVREYTSRY